MGPGRLRGLRGEEGGKGACACLCERARADGAPPVDAPAAPPRSHSRQQTPKRRQKTRARAQTFIGRALPAADDTLRQLHELDLV